MLATQNHSRSFLGTKVLCQAEVGLGGRLLRERKLIAYLTEFSDERSGGANTQRACRIPRIRRYPFPSRQGQSRM